MKIMSLFLALVLTGCATQPVTETVTQIVKIPVPVKCEVPTVDKPVMYFDQAKKENTVFQNLTLLAAENEELKGYSTKLEAALEGCTK